MKKVKFIALTTGEEVQVDANDYAYLSQFSWYGKKQHGKIHAYRHISIGGNDISMRMQRVIMNVKSKTDKVSFIDGDTLNCTRANLEVRALNSNTRKYEPRIKGITVDGNSFRTRICVDGRSISLGSFRDPMDAAAAYDRAAVKLFGNRAVTNL
jgi:hypothetical protein